MPWLALNVQNTQDLSCRFSGPHKSFLANALHGFSGGDSRGRSQSQAVISLPHPQAVLARSYSPANCLLKSDTNSKDEATRFVLQDLHQMEMGGGGR